MHTKNHENCSQIECFMSQKPLAPKFLSQTVIYFSPLGQKSCTNPALPAFAFFCINQSINQSISLY